MKTASTDLNNLFNSRPDSMWMADCVKIVLVTKQVMRYTTADVDVMLPELSGEIFIAPPRATAIRVGRHRSRLGLAVETIDMDFFPRDHLDLTPIEIDEGQETALPIPLKYAMENGAFDGATVEVYRAFHATGPTTLDDFSKAVSDSWERLYFEPTGSLKHFVGFFGPIEEIGAASVKIRAQSMTAKLKAPFPRYVFDHSCVWDHYGNGCRVNKSMYLHTGFVTKASTNRIVLETSPVGAASIDGVALDDRPDDYFSEGIIEFVTGRNSFVKRSVRQSRGGVLTLATSLPYDITINDAFRIAPGCDKTWATCRDKYSNQHRFRGFPFVPGPDSMQGATRPRTVVD